MPAARAPAADAAPPAARTPPEAAGRPRSPRRRVAGTLAAIAVAVALAAVFSLYTRPGTLLDFGQLMQLCGFR